MHRRFLSRLLVAASAGLVIAASTAPLAGAAPTKAGFKTAQLPMLAPDSGAPAGTTVEALLTVGDVVDGFTFESIPDGISLVPHGKGSLSVFINHETSKVPFPYNLPTSASNQNDFDNSQVSELKLHQYSAGVLNGRFVIPSSENYQRFCSNFLATSAQGFSRPILFNNEEGIDWVNESGTAWPATEGGAGARQIGAVVAYDVKAETYKTIWGMGRLNHENNVAIPGYNKPVLLSGDDSFNQVAAQSQVYAYIANNADAVWNDAGDLWAFVPSDADAAVNDYFDFPVGSSTSISGKFVQVPKNIATGKNPDGTDVMSTDIPDYLPPPSNGTWQRGPGITSGPGIDGPQWVLEQWSDLNNAFQFLRIEDIATDKRPGMSNVVYLADSGRGLAPGATFAGQAFPSTNGRIWKMVMDPTDPTTVTSLSILIEGDDNPVKTLNEVHQPDNLETTMNGLYVTEDPGSSQAFSAAQQVSDAARATTARLWQYKFSHPTSTSGSLAAVLKLDQSADQGPTDVDGASSAASWGAWESTGVIDVSSVYGPGKFLVNVQAHSLWIEKAPGPDILAPSTPDWTNKREGGQLLLVTIPGG